MLRRGCVTRACWRKASQLIAASERAGYSMLMIFAFISFRGFRIQVLRHLCRSVSSKADCDTRYESCRCSFALGPTRLPPPPSIGTFKIRCRLSYAHMTPLACLLMTIARPVIVMSLSSLVLLIKYLRWSDLVLNVFGS
jgi:hypothetical protein